MNWVKKSQKEIKERIFSSLKKNVNYQEILKALKARDLADSTRAISPL